MCHQDWVWLKPLSSSPAVVLMTWQLLPQRLTFEKPDLCVVRRKGLGRFLPSSQSCLTFHHLTSASPRLGAPIFDL